MILGLKMLLIYWNFSWVALIITRVAKHGKMNLKIGRMKYQ